MTIITTGSRDGRAAHLGRRLALACALAALAACGAKERRPPNVVVIVLDTLRPDRLGCYGHERDTSPHLDAIAEEFFLFENAQTVSPWTAPSLISLVTSLYPDAHGVKTFPDPGRLSDAAPTLPELLHSRGYATAAITEGGYARGQFGLDRGFDLFADGTGPTESETFAQIHERLAPNMDLAIEWLGQQGDRPFLLFMHTFEVHSPRRAYEEHLRHFRPDYDEAEHRERVRRTVEAWNERGEIDAEGVLLILKESLGAEFHGLPFPADVPRLQERAAEFGLRLEKDSASEHPELVSWVRDLYDAELRYTDMQLARLWDALRATGHWDDTIIVLVSDHGEGLGDRGLIGHGGVLHEELMRVLLMIRVPDPTLPPRRVTEIVRSVDVMPTLLELTGTRHERLRLQGVSLVPLLRGERVELDAFGHALNTNRGRDVRHAIRSGRWRLIHDSDAGTTRLYDIESDPKETLDVAAEHPEVRERLLARLERQRAADAALGADLGRGVSRGLDEAALRELQGLGYVGEDED